MKLHGRHLPGGYVDTLACVVLLRLLEEGPAAGLLTRSLRGLAASPSPENRAAVEQVEAALAQMRLVRALVKQDEAERLGSVDGTAEPGFGDVGAQCGSKSSLGHLTVAQVAERFRVSQGYIRRLCRGQVLSATITGRTWLIELGSVEEYEAKRSRLT